MQLTGLFLQKLFRLPQIYFLIQRQIELEKTDHYVHFKLFSLAYIHSKKEKIMIDFISIFILIILNSIYSETRDIFRLSSLPKTNSTSSFCKNSSVVAEEDDDIVPPKLFVLFQPETEEDDDIIPPRMWILFRPETEEDDDIVPPRMWVLS